MKNKVFVIMVFILVTCYSVALSQGIVSRPPKTPPMNTVKITEIAIKVELTGYINGYRWVDLGLPSGLKWATRNVGAITAEGDGDYFAWGETKSKSGGYYVDNYSLPNLSLALLRSKAIVSKLDALTNQYDAASVNWGQSWRMPTKEDFEELKKYCKWTWTKQVNGNKKGYKVTGPNGQSIFLVAAGKMFGRSSYEKNENIYYWSSTPIGGTAYLLTSDANADIKDDLRHIGCSIRPVSD